MTTRRSLLVGASGGGALWLIGAPSARASLSLAMDVEALTGEAQAVVVAQVVSVSADWERGSRRIVTTVELSVEESWKGGAGRGQRLRIEQPGGTAGDIEMRVHGMPRFTVGQRAVLFLRPRFAGDLGRALAPELALSVVGMAQGKRDLLRDRAGKWMVSPASRDGVVEKQADGRLVPAPAAPGPLSLDDLRAQVRALVAAPRPRR